MKRIVLLILVMLLLTGCSLKEILPESKPQSGWVERTGKPWDREGKLLEVPMVFPEGIHYGAVMEFDGDLLLWSMDSHLADSMILELTVLELDDGSVTAQKEFTVIGYVSPQVLGDRLYLCDNLSGVIVELDKALSETNRWTLEATDGIWYMGADQTLYCHDMDSRFHVTELSSGQTREFLPGCGEIMVYGLYDDTLTLQYYRSDTGTRAYAGLDLMTGNVTHNDIRPSVDSVTIVGDRWLCSQYTDSYTYQLMVPGYRTVEIDASGDYLQLMKDGSIMAVDEMGMYLRLYDGWGQAIASCQISETGSYYSQLPIWNEANGGYFLPVTGYDDHFRLLFLDPKQESDLEDLIITPVPEPSEQEKILRARCDDIAQHYGVNILWGNECNTDYFEFIASPATDYDQLMDAIDILEDALDDFPEDFFRQLRHESIRSINIHLIQNLQATGDDRKDGSYCAFTQEMWDHYLIVADVNYVGTDSYYHEFSHMIDNYLEWDSNQRTDALFSEQQWIDLNSRWFEGYSYDYSAWAESVDYDYFTDAYAMISPTEDRARVLEYAMSEFGSWTFPGAPGLQKKLSYYCRCIRDAFDTSGWSEPLLWEQYLNN